MAEVVVSLDSVLTLQQKIDTASSRTIYGRVLDIFPFPFHGENSAHDHSRTSSHSKDKVRNVSDTVGADNKDYINPIPSLKLFNFSKLEMTIRNFSQDLVIGRNDYGYGEVFLGWVDMNTYAPSTKGVGITFAVNKSSEGLPQWLTVVTSFVRLAHPNTTNLLGYSDDKMYSRLLVYEHMQLQKNLSLSHFLFGEVAEPLSWERRLMIMIEVASGLAYIHSSKEQVIHGGIKTCNILLDQNFSAKLGYFGLAKIHPKILELDDLEVATTNDMDTVRYLDRGNQLNGEMTVESDVYSFGVVLFKTLTGQRAWKPKYGFTLVKWARPFLEDKSKLKDIIDHRLTQNYPLEGAFEWLALATRCVAEDPKARPSSEEVLKSLERIYSVNK
ncbi:hypothetical protein L1887_38552 [Cichorium endivia]|nr:hypothetical protein L1887_38552 [Cichorium endivia]